MNNALRAYCCNCSTKIILSFSSQEDLVVTGGSDGAVNIVRLSTGEKLGVLSQAPNIVYDVKMVGLKVFATAGSKVTVQDIRISRGFREKVNSMIVVICKITAKRGSLSSAR